MTTRNIQTAFHENLAFVSWILIHLPRLHGFFCSSTFSYNLKATGTHELLLTNLSCVSPDSWNWESQVYISIANYKLLSSSSEAWKCFGDIRPPIGLGILPPTRKHRRISSPTVVMNQKHFLTQPSCPPHPNQANNISRFSSNYSIPIPHHTFKHSIRSSRNQKRKYQELIHKFARNSAASQVSFQRHLVTPRMMEFNPGHKPPQVTIAAFTCGTSINREICWCPTGILSSCKDQILGLNV